MAKKKKFKIVIKEQVTPRRTTTEEEGTFRSPQFGDTAKNPRRSLDRNPEKTDGDLTVRQRLRKAAGRSAGPDTRLTAEFPTTHGPGAIDAPPPPPPKIYDTPGSGPGASRQGPPKNRRRWSAAARNLDATRTAPRVATTSTAKPNVTTDDDYTPSYGRPAPATTPPNDLQENKQRKGYKIRILQEGPLGQASMRTTFPDSPSMWKYDVDQNTSTQTPRLTPTAPPRPTRVVSPTPTPVPPNPEEEPADIIEFEPESVSDSVTAHDSTMRYETGIDDEASPDALMDNFTPEEIGEVFSFDYNEEEADWYMNQLSTDPKHTDNPKAQELLRILMGLKRPFTSEPEQVLPRLGLDYNLEDPSEIAATPKKSVSVSLVQIPRETKFYKTRSKARYATSAVKDYLDGLPSELGFHHLGNMTRRKGGKWKNSPHKSHQTGIDIDFPVFVKGKTKNRLRRFKTETMDIDRALKFLIYSADHAGKIFFDKSYNKILRNAAWGRVKNNQMSKELHAKIFGVWKSKNGVERRVRKGILQHVSGHRDHFHVRLNTPGFKDKNKDGRVDK